MPLYNQFTYLVRFCGIINAMTRKASWKTQTFTEEKKMFTDEVKQDFKFFSTVKNKVRYLLEKEETI